MECPDCGKSVYGRSCKACGWKDLEAKAVESDPMRFLCAHEVRGLRCGNVGTLSPSTVGGGPWFCWDHANHVHGGDPVKGRMCVDEQILANIRKFGKVDYEAIAERLAIEQR